MRRYALPAILLLALGIRLFRLASHPLWLDEAHMVFIASFSTVRDVLDFVNNLEVHPPLYYLIVHYLVQVSGDPFWLRLPSALCGTLSVYALFLLGRALWDEAAGLLAAGLLAMSAYEMPFSQEVRMYPILLLLVTLSAWSLTEAVAGGRTKHWALFVLYAALGMYVDHRIVLVLAASLAYFWATHRDRARALWLAAIAIGLLCLPEMSILRHQSSPEGGAPSVSAFFAAPSIHTVLRSLHAMFLGDILQVSTPVADAVGVLVLLWILAGAWAAWREAGPRALLAPFVFAFCQAVMIVYSLLRSHIYTVHHMVFALPFFWISIVQGVRWLYRKSAVACYLVLGLFLVVNLAAIEQWDFNPACTKQNFPAVTAYLENHAQPGDAIVIVPEYQRYPFQYYYRGRNRVLMVNPRTLPELEAELQHDTRVWFVFAYELPIDPAQVIRKWVNDHFQVEDMQSFPNLPYEVTGKATELYLGVRKPSP